MKWFLVFLVILVIFGYTGYVLYERMGGGAVVESSETGYRSATIALLALSEDDTGSVIPLTVDIRPGDGKILMNINSPSFITDTQGSIRIAVHEAARITDKDVSKLDITFSLKTDASVVGGPSAGAAMTAAVTAALLGKQINPGVTITGTISAGGAVGSVDGIPEKAIAAQQAGITTLLVPMGESEFTEPIQNCTENKGKKNGGETWERNCTVTYARTSISQVSGISVIEVGAIEQALPYLIK
jgi:uncharacterized protein